MTVQTICGQLFSVSIQFETKDIYQFYAMFLHNRTAFFVRQRGKNIVNPHILSKKKQFG